jgi:hypothetical protein
VLTVTPLSYVPRLLEGLHCGTAPDAYTPLSIYLLFNVKLINDRCSNFIYLQFWVYLMINNQPIFIKGIQPKGAQAIEGVTFKVSTAEQRLPSAANA